MCGGLLLIDWRGWLDCFDELSGFVVLVGGDGVEFFFVFVVVVGVE